MGLKIAVLGAAGSYTPELFANLIDINDRFQVDQVALMDPNAEKLNLIAAVSKKVLKSAKSEIKVSATQDRIEALTGADYVILQIRVGGSVARIRDELLPMKFNLIGNETAGAGGFISALRTIPLVLDIAHDIERVAPEAWLMVLANPGGILTEAILKHSAVHVVGYCNIPINTQYAFAEILNVPPERVVIDSFGLNHLSWVREIYVDGEGTLEELIAQTRSRRSKIYGHNNRVDTLIDPELLHTIGLVPSWYLRYFYYQEKVLRMEKRSQISGGQRDIIADERILEIFAREGYNEEAREILNSKGGARYYIPVLQVIDSQIHDRGDLVIADVRNGDTMPDLPPEVAVEVPARFYRGRIEPIRVGSMPLSVRSLVQAIKTYEELTIEAAITGDRKLALQAMMANPLIGSYSKAKAFFDRSLKEERTYFPEFFNPL
jgi:6-phospho-beta-glucosidase